MKFIQFLIISLLIFNFSKGQDMSTSNLFTGVAYSDYYENMYEGKHPFYNKNAFTSSGYVYYFGRPYSDVFLKYDVIKDELITIYSDGVSNITLFPEQVDSFKIYNQLFIRLFDEQKKNPKYYAQLYAGNHYKLLIRYTKTVLPQQYVDGALYDLVSEKNYYYLMGIDNKLKELKGTKSLENLMDINHKAAKKTLHNSKDTESNYITLLKEFDTNK